MWSYEKTLQYPVKIKNPDPELAQVILSQFGGPDGELGASMRYLSQRYAQPNDKVKGILNDIGTEELAHSEMIAAIVYQLTKNMTVEDVKRSGFDTYFVDHTAGIYPVAASGVPFDAFLQMAVNKFGTKEGRISSKSEAIGFDNFTPFEPKYFANLESINDQVIA